MPTCYGRVLTSSILKKIMDICCYGFLTFMNKFLLRFLKLNELVAKYLFFSTLTT